jgi:hypothetical protein
VWIGESPSRRSDPDLVVKAMNVWTNAAAGRFRLERSTDRTAADVRVIFSTSDVHLGETAPLYDRRTGVIVSAEVAIATNVAGDSLTQQLVVYMTALHELGHALGLPHTATFADVMYFFTRPDDAEWYFAAYRAHLRSAADIGSARATGLSAGDLSALHALYRD